MLLLVYVAAFMVFVSLGDKKQDRYLLPSLVMMNVVAAVGVSAVVDETHTIVATWRSRSRGRSSPRFDHLLSGSLILVVVVVQTITCLPHSPYYSTFYNPLLGGNQAAARYLLVGWGEGNELAAGYLNRLPGAERMTVVASMPTTLAPFFKGETRLWWPQAKVFAADYVVLHRRDVQRGQPDPHLVRHIYQTWPLEETITLHGLPYVWIYRAPAADWTLPIEDEDSPMGRTGLMGYRVDPKQLARGQKLTVTLYVRHQPAVDGRWVVRLQGTSGQWDGHHQMTRTDGSAPEPGTVFEEVYSVDVASTIHPGAYQLKIGFQEEARTQRPQISWMSFPMPQVHIVE